MHWKLSCPKCGTELRPKREWAGRTGRCRACSQPLTIPAYRWGSGKLKSWLQTAADSPWAAHLVRIVSRISTRFGSHGKNGAIVLGVFVMFLGISQFLFSSDSSSGQNNHHQNEKATGEVGNGEASLPSRPQVVRPKVPHSENIQDEKSLEAAKVQSASASTPKAGPAIPAALTSQYATPEEVVGAAEKVLNERVTSPKVFSKALPAIAAHLKSDNRWVMARIAGMFWQLTYKAPELLKPVETQIIGALARPLPVDDYSSRENAQYARRSLVYAIHRMQSESAITGLIKVIRDSEDFQDTMSSALTSLSHFNIEEQHQEQLAAALTPLLKVDSLRVGAIQAIGNCGELGRKLIPELRKLLERQSSGFNDYKSRSLTIAGTILVLDPTQKDMLELLIEWARKAEPLASLQLARCGSPAKEALPVLRGRLEVSKDSREIKALESAIASISHVPKLRKQ